MSKRNQGNPFIEMGNLIRSWREEKYKSARAMFMDAKFSFSYSYYADFEKGAACPTPENLIELASHFKKEVYDAVILWSSVQMPTEDLRNLFQSRRKSRAERESISHKTEKFDFENTWVFSEKDMEILIQTPWLWEVCIVLGMEHPEVVSINSVHLPQDVKPHELLDNYLKYWIEAGRIIVKNDKIKLALPHIYIPFNDKGKKVRENNTKRVGNELIKNITQEMIDTKKAYNLLGHRPLTPGQAKKWVSILQNMEANFKEEKYISSKEDPESKCYAISILFSPRELKK